MHIAQRIRTVSFLVAAGLLALPVCAQQQQQESVAEAARRAREQKKAPPKPAKVYTEDELPRRTHGEATAAPTPAGEPGTDKTPGDKKADGGAGAAAKADGKAAEEGGASKEEKAWRGRFKQAREKLARAEKELSVLERESSKAQKQYYADPNKAMREQFSRKEFNDKNAQIEAKKKEIADLKQVLEKLEEDLRKNGGDPGWAR